MEWTVKYFQFYNHTWENWAEEREMDVDESIHNQGLRSYAYKQAHTWAKLESRAYESFEFTLGQD